MKQSVLLISPRTEHMTSVCAVLKSSGFDVVQIESVDGIRAGLLSHSPAFLLLDIDMKNSRKYLLEASRSLNPPTPYIIAAGTFSASIDYVALLDLGADVCISKPITAGEILSVINAVFRRESRNARLGVGRLLPCIKHKDLAIDPLRRTVEMRNEPVALTAKEFDILYLLAYRAGDVLTKEDIYESVWNSEYDFTATNVSDHISVIRRKLKLDKRDRDYIQTVFGIGYRFAEIE